MLLVKANFSLFSYSVFLVLEINLWRKKTCCQRVPKIFLFDLGCLKLTTVQLCTMVDNQMKLNRFGFRVPFIIKILCWVERESELSKYGVKKAAVICQSIELSINSNILCLQIGELVWQFGNDISFNTFSCMSVKNCAIEDKT